MEYSCDEIKYLLIHGESEPENPEAFIDHIESCSRCAKSTGIEPELEALLSAASNPSSAVSFERYVLSRIRKYERAVSREAKMDRLFAPVLGFFAAIPLFLATFYWGEIKSFIKSINPDRFFDYFLSLIADIQLPSIDLSGIANAITNSPFVFLTLVSAIAILWTFSLIEAQKALK